MKGLGYLISTVSVIFLGIVAWPKPEDPRWKAWAVAIGMATSILGMCSRYISHLHSKREIEKAKEEPNGAQRADGQSQ